MEINDVRCSKKDLKQVQSILKKNFKLALKVRSNLPGVCSNSSQPPLMCMVIFNVLYCRIQAFHG